MPVAAAVGVIPCDARYLGIGDGSLVHVLAVRASCLRDTVRILYPYLRLEDKRCVCPVGQIASVRIVVNLLVTADDAEYRQYARWLGSHGERKLGRFLCHSRRFYSSVIYPVTEPP